jgi:hypothetical protein
LRAEIYRETNTEGEDFVSDTELLTWANDAKDEAEKEIVGLYDKYFETEASLALVSGTSLYAPPADILANKVTGLFYNNGSDKYEIKLLKRKEDILVVNDNDEYRFRMVNVAGTGPRIKLYPASRETSASNVTVFYIRESAAIEEDADYVDIPIADGFIKQYVKDKIKQKEIGPMNITDESPDLRRERRLMMEALSHMIPSDSADELEMGDNYYDEIDWY